MKKFLKKEEVGRLAEMLLASVERTGKNASISFSKDYDGELRIDVIIPCDSDPFRCERVCLMPEPSRAEDVVGSIMVEMEQEV